VALFVQLRFRRRCRKAGNDLAVEATETGSSPGRENERVKTVDHDDAIRSFFLSLSLDLSLWRPEVHYCGSPLISMQAIPWPWRLRFQGMEKKAILSFHLLLQLQQQLSIVGRRRNKADVDLVFPSFFLSFFSLLSLFLFAALVFAGH
jgi:hypothetical protein